MFDPFMKDIYHKHAGKADKAPLCFCLFTAVIISSFFSPVWWSRVYQTASPTQKHHGGTVTPAPFFKQPSISKKEETHRNFHVTSVCCTLNHSSQDLWSRRNFTSYSLGMHRHVHSIWFYPSRWWIHIMSAAALLKKRLSLVKGQLSSRHF